MFCPNCGTNAGDAAFCSSCGTNLKVLPEAAAASSATNPEPGSFDSAPPAYINPAPKKSNKTLFIALGGGVSAVALAVVAVFAFMPYSLSADKANEILVPMSSFASEMKVADNPKHIGEMDYPVFGTGADDGCAEEGEIVAAFDQGKLLAFSDYANDGTDFGVWGQSFWEFDSADTPAAIVAAMRSGYDNSDCAYYSSTSTSIMTSTMTDLGSSGEAFGVDSPNSAFFVDKTSYISSLISFELKQGLLFVQKGRYLMSIRFSTDPDSTSVYSDFEDMTKLALESFH